MEQAIDKILRERLNAFNVPTEIQQSIRNEICAYVGRPEKRIHGACTMSAEASFAADQARMNKKVQSPDSEKPKII